MPAPAAPAIPARFRRNPESMKTIRKTMPLPLQHDRQKMVQGSLPCRWRPVFRYKNLSFFYLTTPITNGRIFQNLITPI
ncbi:hypothetical protein LH435_00165 [Laribacter hongkongensis]|uniref:hypothetical protein n=1 Tax=Laribacter hongkongensis TaxID=168471 RepID=UPI001EFC9707|nr:hypothetical protein [Laribacter hongkongensis]MCG8995137.1 hypothetical protein [Laribacter hongkongensis]MCG9010191.1 hypothetical protein [Laribacter hongkongensis]MCG9021664.1 hypothetical protein [Laribacter hongkongensis]MCG9047001.1 hypothetical protein [Laribacter hongkongensis]MCG9072443.1 hypothetical protein [Laribacter hongkongensis]